MKKHEKYQYKPTPFMLPTSHYDKNRADRAVLFIQSLKHTKGIWSGKAFYLFPWRSRSSATCLAHQGEGFPAVQHRIHRNRQEERQVRGCRRCSAVYALRRQ